MSDDSLKDENQDFGWARAKSVENFETGAEQTAEDKQKSNAAENAYEAETWGDAVMGGQNTSNNYEEQKSRGANANYESYQQFYEQQPGMNQQENPYNPYEQPKNGMGIASLVLGIISLVLFFSGINIILAILAIIFGAVQLSRRTQKGMAIAGIITGAISIAAFFIMTIIFTFAIGSVISNEGDWQQIYDDIYEDTYDQVYDELDEVRYDTESGQYEFVHNAVEHHAVDHHAE